jgi:phosphoglycerate dehydrogenase-like enzyme
MGNKKKVILDIASRRLDEVFHPDDLQHLHAIADVVWGRDEPMPAAEFEAAKGDAFAIVTGRWRHGDVAGMPKLRAILEMAGRHPSPSVLDYRTCFARNIRVLSVSPAFGPMVAEAALAMALAAARDVVSGSVAFQTGTEQYQHRGNERTFTLYDETVGLIGCGSLARNLMPLLAPFRCKLLGYDPWISDRYLTRMGVQPTALESLLQQSRVIFVLAIPSTENRALLDRARLELIQPNAVLALMSRAHVVDFDALTEMLYAGRFKAAIDVFPKEPVPEDHPIRHAPNAVLAAHRAGTVREDMWELGRIAVNDLEALLQGLPPREMQQADPDIVFRLR